jgi:hypothetical protein
MKRSLSRITLAVAGLSLLAASGCVVFPVGGRTSAAVGARDSALRRGLREYRVAFHCHSLLSHDSDVPFERIARAARSAGIDCIILNDHYEPGNIAKAPRGFIDGVLFIPGVELRAAGGGSILAFGMTGDFDPKAPKAELCARFKAEGGLVFAGHVERIQSWGEIAFDGFEVYNLHAEFEAHSAGDLLWRFLVLPPDAFFESSIRTPAANLAQWDLRLRAGERLPPLLGCDAHENIRLFGPLGGTIGTYPQLLRLFSSHVAAADLRADLILDALRRGRVFGAFDCFGDARGFQAAYGRRSAPNDAHAIIGESARFDPEAELFVDTPAPATIRVLRDGEIIHESDGQGLALALPGPGVYRVEAHRQGKLWIVASPLYLMPEGAPDQSPAAGASSSPLPAGGADTAPLRVPPDEKPL